MIDNFNNAVTDRGHLVGYRCYRCSGIFQSMWGTTCNKCRGEESYYNAMRKAVTDERED
jgi:rRNA maturation endonuclease Nob1